jgi:hypothetical protein
LETLLRHVHPLKAIRAIASSDKVSGSGTRFAAMPVKRTSEPATIAVVIIVRHLDPDAIQQLRKAQRDSEIDQRSDAGSEFVNLQAK